MAAKRLKQGHCFGSSVAEHAKLKQGDRVVFVPVVSNGIPRVRGTYYYDPEGKIDGTVYFKSSGAYSCWSWEGHPEFQGWLEKWQAANA